MLKKRAKIRLWINNNFVDVYYNPENEIISYTYIEKEKRIFGVNNMKIGWHLHPFGESDKHESTEPISIDKFLKILENELKKRNKI